MTKEITLQQLAREAGATDSHEWFVPHQTALMHRPRRHTFARATFAKDQNGGGARGGTKQDIQRPTRGFISHFEVSLGCLSGHLSLKLDDLFGEVSVFLKSSQHEITLRTLAWLLQKIQCTESHGFDGRLDRGVRSENDDGLIRIGD